MLLNNLKIGFKLVASFLLVGGAHLMAYSSGAGTQVVTNPRPQPQPPEAKPKEPLTRLDLYGDALPAGAVARLDTLRFRHADVIAFAAFLPDGKHVITVADDGIICVWAFPSGKEISRIEACPARDRPADMAVNGMNSAALSPDGKTIATSFSLAVPTRGKGGKGLKGGGPLDKPAVLPQQDIRLHDVATGKQRSVLKTDTAAVTALSFSPNGQQLSAWCSDRTIRFWDWANAKELNKVDSMAAGGRISPFTGALLRSVKGGFPVYAPDGKTLMLFGTSRVLQFMDVATGKEVGPNLGHTVSLTSISFTPDGKQMLTQAGNFTHKWDVGSSKTLGTLKLPPASTRAIAVSADGRVGVAVHDLRPDQALGGFGFGPRTTFKDPDLFDTANGKVLGKIADEFTPDSAMVFSPDGKILAATGVGAEPKISFYEVPGGKLLHASDAIPGALPVGKGGGPGRANPGIKLLFAPDGKTLAVHAGPVGTALIFLDTKGKQIGSLASPADVPVITLSAFSADGRCLAVEKSNGEVLLYELASGQPRRTFTNTALPPAEKISLADSLLFGSSGISPSVSLALSPDGRCLALAGGDGAVRLMDVLTGKELAVFTGHKGAVNAVAFAPHGKTLASASADMTALIWDITNIEMPPPAKAPQPGNLEAQWKMLADKDAAKAFAALGDFAAPKDGVAFLKDKIMPAQPLDGKRVEALIRQMDNGNFQMRDQATRELLNLGEPILPALDNALATNRPLESKRRLEDLRSKLTGMVLEGERLRVDRALEVLERIGTPEARAVLQALADGAPGALVTTRARAALNR